MVSTGREMRSILVRFKEHTSKCDVGNITAFDHFKFLFFSGLLWTYIYISVKLSPSGVWVNKNKIAAIGLSSARWITTHGFAININPDLNMFDSSIIIPCGIEGRGVTSIARELQRQKTNDKIQIPCITDVAEVVLDSVTEVFRVPIQSGDHLI